ncbi:hypothetical protein CLG96_12640 [Sphingomonas oleivorans]|uniref:DUF2891 domain-containing protein n=1 Tax=Sphingomonas oleivorans TaxID=1735121 RepID=A0A2T5FW35_9SPHN|nr:DUF2891 domain-containing protein [Sphingomonas oleivorans]PTQ09988.1 hypothetical protein CLG96_12640 [Sphingomonas oleivorans]
MIPAPPHALDPATAQRFARIALGHVTRQYPHKLDHVMAEPQDVRAPAELHPIFFGSFDWHSCVHGYWLLLRLLRRFPDIAAAADIRRLANAMLTPEKALAERAYLDRPASAGFERPYGWAWLLALHGEAARHDAGWADALAPLARAFADRFLAFLPKLSYPIRTGTHFNTAFALILALEWAEERDPALTAMIRARACDYFAADRACPGWEPGGDEFLSSALVEALCMRRVLPPAEFRIWFADFLPDLARGEPATLFTPAFVSDRSDGKIAHLDGFNFSRAWCWRAIADALDPRLAERACRAAAHHLEASLAYVAGDYMGEHWLATFATLALEA